jgi:hypothetical protein
MIAQVLEDEEWFPSQRGSNEKRIAQNPLKDIISRSIKHCECAAYLHPTVKILPVRNKPVYYEDVPGVTITSISYQPSRIGSNDLFVKGRFHNYKVIFPVGVVGELLSSKSGGWICSCQDLRQVQRLVQKKNLKQEYVAFMEESHHHRQKLLFQWMEPILCPKRS